MTSASSQTMQREISVVRDEHRSGALDLEWAGAHASIFFVFGQPSHATFENAAGLALDGTAALSALVKELPDDIRVAAWRPLLVDADTLHCSGDELMALFADTTPRQPGPGGRRKYDPPSRDAVAADAGAVPAAFRRDTGAPLPFGVVDFPLLPLGDLLWTDAAAEISELDAIVPRLPDSAIVLHGTNRRAVALIQGGEVRDAVWVDGRMGLLGNDAAGALMTTADGVLSAYRIDDPRLFDVLPLLWRAQRPTGDMPAAWLDAAAIVAESRAAARTFALLVDGEHSGTALFNGGTLVAVYSTARKKRPAPTTNALRTLLAMADARITLVTPTDGPFEDRRRHRALPASLFVAEVPEALGRESTPSSALAEEDIPADTAEVIAEFDAEVAAGTPLDLAAAELVAEEVVTEPEAAPPGLAEEPAAEVEPTEAPADEPEVSAPVALDTTETQSESPYRPNYAERSAPPLFETPGSASPVDAPDPEVEPAPAAQAEPVAVAPPEPVATPPVPTVSVFAAVTPEFVDAPPASTRAGRTLIPAWLRGAGRHASTTVPQAEDAGAVRSPAATAPAPPADTGLTDAGTEFVPARLDIDVDLLRKELIDIATVWLGESDAAPVAGVIVAARPGVDDFVAAIASISAMEVPGHEHAVVRAMAREMHFRATEVLCGV